MTKEQRVKETVGRMLRAVPSEFRALICLVDRNGAVSVATNLQPDEAIECAKGAVRALPELQLKQCELWKDDN
jgi:hypothetical protein